MVELLYDELRIKKKVLISGGTIKLGETGVYLVHGDNGTGKTLLLNNIHTNAKGLTVLIAQGNTEIIPSLSVEGNIAMRALDSPNENIRGLLKKYELSYLLDLKPGKMSGGEKRIVLLLRGIFSDAPIVLIDEPTNDLDFAMVRKLKKIISDFSRFKRFLIVTHDDRLISLAKGSVTIRANRMTNDGSLKIVGNPVKQGSKPETQKMDSYDEGLISVVWKRGANIVGIAALTVMCALSVSLLLSRGTADEIATAYMPGNQINLMAPNSNYVVTVQKYSALPITIMKDILAGGLWGSANEIDNLFNDPNLPLIHSLPELPDSENYTVYPLEFYADRHYLSVFDIYLSNYIDIDTQLAWVDTSGYFFTEPKLGDRFEFDPELFSKSVVAAKEAISVQGNHYMPICYLVVLKNGYSLQDFLSELPESFYSPSIFIQTKETIAAAAEIAAILRQQDDIKTLAGQCAILLSVEIAYILLYCTVQMNGLRILVNYGYNALAVRKKIFHISNDTLLRLACCLALAGLIFFISDVDKYIAGDYALAFVVAGATFLGYIIKRFVITFFLRLVYSWKYR